MVAGERPTKFRKLSHGSRDDDATSQSDVKSQDLHESHKEHAIDRPKENTSKSTQVSAADRADGEEEILGEVNGDMPTLSGEPDVQQSSPLISKNQLKKQRKREEWEAGRDWRKVKRKEKIVAKKIRKKEARQQVQDNPTNGHVEKQHRIRGHTKLPITFVIDCEFDDLMLEKERISLGSQLTRSYSDNHRAPFQAHLIVSSWGGLLKERFDTVLNRHHENWRGVKFIEGDIVEAAKVAKNLMSGRQGGKFAGAFAGLGHNQIDAEDNAPENPPKSSAGRDSNAVLATVDPEDQAQEPLAPSNGSGEDRLTSDIDNSKSPSSLKTPPTGAQLPPPLPNSHSQTPESEIIYLTSDSPHTLTTLKPHSIYIIGGLVDKNRHKGICYRTACEKGIQTAKLPIGEFMEMQSRFVLATNHVLEIMVRWLETGDWGEAFMSVIPKRKGGKLKGDGGDDGEGSLDADEEAEETGDAGAEDTLIADAMGEEHEDADE